MMALSINMRFSFFYDSNLLSHLSLLGSLLLRHLGKRLIQALLSVYALHRLIGKVDNYKVHQLLYKDHLCRPLYIG